MQWARSPAPSSHAAHWPRCQPARRTAVSNAPYLVQQIRRIIQGEVLSGVFGGVCCIWEKFRGASIRIKAAAKSLGAGERGDGLADTATYFVEHGGLCRRPGVAPCMSTVLPASPARRLFASTPRQLHAA